MDQLMISLAFFGAILANLVSSHSGYLVKEFYAAPDQWLRLGPAPQDHVFELHIGVRQHSVDKLTEQLLKVSCPSHLNYGKYLSRAEVDALIQPTYETISSVKQWLAAHAIHEIVYNAAKDWLTVRISITEANRLLGTTYSVFRHSQDGSLLIRTEAWSLPEHLMEHIDTIQPTNSFLRTKGRITAAMVTSPPSYDELAAEDLLDFDHIPIPDIAELPEHPTADQACNDMAVSPLCLRTLYGTLDYEPKRPQDNSFAIVNFLGEVNNRSDVDIFLRKYRSDAAEEGVAHSFRTEIVAGGIDDQHPNPNIGYEGALDVQAALGVGHPTRLVAYNVGGGSPPFLQSAATLQNRNEPYLVWLQHVLAQDNLPRVMSISYADEEQTVPPSYARRVCSGFAQLGGRGITVLVSSGDAGVGRSSCKSNGDGNDTVFQPEFPATCPYVTAVGATRHHNPEVVAFDARTGFVSGGGFSRYFDRPAYQDAVVQAYIDNVMGPEKHNGSWNIHGRGIPDIAAAGYHYPIMWNGTTHLTDGTSASAPTVAAIIALVNDALLAEGRPALGWMNPWLYEKGWEAFVDIVHGNVTGCETTGFPASPGWDAASGFGTPWFPKLKDLALEKLSQRPWYYGTA